MHPERQILFLLFTFFLYALFDIGCPRPTGEDDQNRVDSPFDYNEGAIDEDHYEEKEQLLGFDKDGNPNLDLEKNLVDTPFDYDEGEIDEDHYEEKEQLLGFDKDGNPNLDLEHLSEKDLDYLPPELSNDDETDTDHYGDKEQLLDFDKDEPPNFDLEV